jgi:hypothetical protein
MRNITLEQVTHIFRSENEISIPLLPERQKVLNVLLVFVE